MRWIGFGLIAVALVCVAWGAAVDMAAPTGFWETGGAIFRDVFVLLGSVAGSWMVTLTATQNHARSAFRRLWAIRTEMEKIGNLATAESNDDRRIALARIEQIAQSSKTAAQDALSDWLDMAPWDVADLNKELRSDADDGPTPLAPGAISGTREEEA